MLSPYTRPVALPFSHSLQEGGVLAGVSGTGRLVDFVLSRTVSGNTRLTYVYEGFPPRTIF